MALVTRGSDNKPLAIHRTFLVRDGGGKAPVDPQKMMLGPCRVGAVRLAEPGDVLMVGEGIETCLAAMQATGQPAWAALHAWLHSRCWTAWHAGRKTGAVAALSSMGNTHMRTLQ